MNLIDTNADDVPTFISVSNPFKPSAKFDVNDVLYIAIKDVKLFHKFLDYGIANGHLPSIIATNIDRVKDTIKVLDIADNNVYMTFVKAVFEGVFFDLSELTEENLDSILQSVAPKQITANDNDTTEMVLLENPYRDKDYTPTKATPKAVFACRNIKEVEDWIKKNNLPGGVELNMKHARILDLDEAHIVHAACTKQPGYMFINLIKD